MLNKVTLMGRLTADPELKSTQSGISVTSFSIAVERNFTDKDGNKIADFINVVAWRSAAEFISKYFEKGRMIAVDGSIQTRSYIDKEGNKRTAFEVIVEHAYFADSKTKEMGSQESSIVNPPKPKASGGVSVAQSAQNFSVGDFEDVDMSDDDLPF